ncbi:MAG: Asp-tRNA(Asn)/Glu-tRNA(Gln) amidotransferase subunit GatC [Nitrososphaerales archaeon]|nr:Asp-tRNA(Asn)/Glu-tRNA(Gln) amidotransferase subunit GatC [Nitrososphaerales archaeon]
MTLKEIKHIAWLARIELSKKEEALFREQLNEILEYFKKIDEVDVKNIPPTYHVVDIVNVFRPDEVRTFDADKILSTVPQMKERYVKGPRAI